MPYVAPDIDDDDLALLLANPTRAAALKAGASGQPVAPPGVNPALLQPAPMVPAAALAKPAMSTGVPMMPNGGPPAAPMITQPTPATPPPFENALAQTTRAVLAQRPQPPTAMDDPYLPKINDLQTQISNAKPKLWERLLGGTAAGLIAYGSHNPAEGIEAGSHVTNRQRENLQAKLEPLQEQEQQYQTRTQRDFQQKHQSFEDALRSTDEQRKQADSDALQQERVAKAGRQDYLSMSPKERAAEVSDLEKTSGMKFTDEQKQDFILTGKVPASRTSKPSLSETIAQRRQEGMAAGLKGNNLQQYALTGKLTEPNPDAEARLEEARLRRMDSENDRSQRQDDLNFNRHQLRSQQYASKKAEIADRERRAYEQLEQQSRDRKTGAVVDEKTLNNRKAEIQRSFDAEYNALGPEPQESPTRRTAASQPAPAKSAKPSAAETYTYKGKQFTKGQKVTVGGKEQTVKGMNPKTGKLIVGD